MHVVRQGVKALLTACLPRERWLVRGRRARGVHGPAISLTFDDGPHPVYTPQVLDRLDALGWKGTFFVVGEKAAAYPELIRRMVGAGHELGNHTYTHGEPGKTSAAAFRDEVRQTQQLLEDLAGRPVTLMRPPKGELTWAKLQGLWRDRQTVALWSADPRDYQYHHEQELRRWLSAYVPRHGDVVLMHDVHPHVLTILDTWQATGRLAGMSTVTLSAWLPNGALASSAAAGATRLRTETEGLSCP